MTSARVFSSGPIAVAFESMVASFFPRTSTRRRRAPSFVMVPGTIFDQPDRWQKLELVQMLPTIERLARSSGLRPAARSHSKGRTLSGLSSTCWIVPASRTFFSTISKSARSLKRCSRHGRRPNRPAIAGGKDARRSRGETVDPRHEDVSASSVTCSKSGGATPGSCRGFRPRSMPLERTPPSCGCAGFDVLVDDGQMDPERAQAAVGNGVLLMKRLTGATSTEGPQRLLDQMSNYPLRQSVAFWHLGDRLGRPREIKTRDDELAKFRESLTAIRGFDDDVSQLVTANVEGEFPLFARAPSGLDVIGIQPRMWASCQNYMDVYEYYGSAKTADGAFQPGQFFLGLDPRDDTTGGGSKYLGR